MHDTESLAATAIDLGKHAPNVAHARFDPKLDERPVPAVLEALAEAADRPVDELDVHLHDVVDPDALNDLFRPTRTGHTRSGGSVSFAIDGFAVEITDGHVIVCRTG